MSGFSVQRYPTRWEALQTVATCVRQTLEFALANHHRVTFGVCGGRTAEVLFPMLAESPLNWDSVDVLLIDERWVSSESAKSNEKLVRDTLLQCSACPSRKDQPRPLGFEKRQVHHSADLWRQEAGTV